MTGLFVVLQAKIDFLILYIVPILHFSWFKFTLKSPYTIAHEHLLLAIWDTSHWTSFVKFGLKTA